MERRCISGRMVGADVAQRTLRTLAEGPFWRTWRGGTDRFRFWRTGGRTDRQDAGLHVYLLPGMAWLLAVGILTGMLALQRACHFSSLFLCTDTAGGFVFVSYAFVCL